MNNKYIKFAEDDLDECLSKLICGYVIQGLDKTKIEKKLLTTIKLKLKEQYD